MQLAAFATLVLVLAATSSHAAPVKPNSEMDNIDLGLKQGDADASGSKPQYSAPTMVAKNYGEPAPAQAPEQEQSQACADENRPAKMQGGGCGLDLDICSWFDFDLSCW
ncbi:hypothetical protein H4R34_001234 [Dimargaris verticillata]|uniref:Uncharacterized protein n=1 Tax=Dimargaris verticillata TaxID=2761393 RepID=A0A9W8EDZ3_9FUNG|nr:hypothetical protein H4R34_001234 [Dimargaris verticillata]